MFEQFLLWKKFPIYTKFMFFKSPGEVGDLYRFSSDLEKIGVEWDVSIQNGTHVEVISDPIEIESSLYGRTLSLIKVKADVAMDYHTIIKEFWVPTDCVLELKSENSINEGE